MEGDFSTRMYQMELSPILKTVFLYTGNVFFLSTERACL